jgi:hypothetical protein
MLDALVDGRPLWVAAWGAWLGAVILIELATREEIN